MKLTIADPPYLGRADRWYGAGRGGGRTRADGNYVKNGRKPDLHPDAAEWDSPERHQQLIADLERDFDGWALAGAADSLQVLPEAAPPRARIGVWAKRNSIPGGSRVLNRWEPVLFRVPDERRDRSTGLAVSDILISATNTRQGFLGSKPPEWTRWVLGLLGYQPDVDELTDVFPGSGIVARVAEGYLPLPVDPGMSEVADTLAEPWKETP